MVSALGASLNVQGARPGVSYAAWAGGHPLLADPDSDGCPNRLEYGAGSDALDSSSQPACSISFENLTSIGHGPRDVVFRFTVAVNRGNIALAPATSVDLLEWSSASLEFLDATDLGASIHQFRFRIAGAQGPTRFFRLYGD